MPSTMRWPFVPPYPKELMLTRLTNKWAGKKVDSVTTLTCHLSHSTGIGQSISNQQSAFDLLLGFGRSGPIVGGMTPFSTIKHALIRAERPLAASEWPMFVFTCNESVRSMLKSIIVDLLLQSRGDLVRDFADHSSHLRQR